MTGKSSSVRVFLWSMLGTLGGVLPAAGCTGACGNCFSCAGLGGLAAVAAAVGWARGRKPEVKVESCLVLGPAHRENP